MAAPRCHADQKAHQGPLQCSDAPSHKAFDDPIPLLRAAVARSTASSSNVMASMRPTKRPSLVGFAVQRKSVTDTSVYVIFTAPPVHSSLLLEPIDSEFHTIGNHKNQSNIKIVGIIYILSSRFSILLDIKSKMRNRVFRAVAFHL